MQPNLFLQFLLTLAKAQLLYVYSWGSWDTFIQAQCEFWHHTEPASGSTWCLRCAKCKQTQSTNHQRTLMAAHAASARN